MTRQLDVWWDTRRVGELTQDRSGDLAFGYAAEWLDDADTPALSVSLPKRAEAFSRKECRPFFAGLLPDEIQRKRAASALGVSEANDFALLDGMGGDVAGAIQLLPPDAAPPSLSYEPQTKALTDGELAAVLDQLPAHPLLAGETGLRLSLAGAQSKLPVVLIDGAIALPASGQPTTHIIKPPITQLHATTENEAAIMRLAGAVGLDVPPVEIRVVANKPFLLVERYDRARSPDSKTRRLHQEDFCQALGIPPEHKYSAEGGPVFKTSFDLIRRVSTYPARDVLKLLDTAIFNIIVGNADAHGKNFSILYDDGSRRLAPRYDLLSTLQYPSLSPKFAMRIGRAATLENLDDNSWSRFIADAGVSAPLLRHRANELSGLVRDHIEAVCADLAFDYTDPEALARLANTIRRRAEILSLKLPKASPVRAGARAAERQSK